MHDKVNLEEVLSRVDEPFRPKIVGTMNDYKLQVGKIKEGAEILLIEPLGTVNTGDAPPSELTATEERLERA